MLPENRLLIATIAEDIDEALATGAAGVEIDTFCVATNMEGDAFAARDAEVRRLLSLAGDGPHVLHAPFAELYPAAIDPLARDLALRRLTQAAEVASSYGIDRLVVHGGYVPKVYDPSWYVERASAFFAAFLAGMPASFSLLIENVLEDDPAVFGRMIARIGDPRAKACLDIGHAHCESGVPVDRWIDLLGPQIGHVHVHNNDGTGDAHGGLSEGTLDIPPLLERVRRTSPDATFALEMRRAMPSLQGLLSAAKPQAQAQPQDADAHGIFRTLKQVFGYTEFRAGQQPLIEAQLSGRDAMGIMPTGSGKSICFQLPALLLEGVTLVVSPLISLMKDQVAALRLAGVEAAFLNSSLTERQFDAAMRNAMAGKYRLIYVAPERLMTPRFLAFAAQARIALVAVDEAHCISQWGQDFRPSYLDIPRFVGALARRPVVSAFTATATAAVKDDILRMLSLQAPCVVQTGFDRPNLYYEVQRPKKKREALHALLGRYAGQSGIVYCATRKNVEELCEDLSQRGILATRYHAGLSDMERARNQEDFTNDRAQVIVATNAFGMGIDKSNVRFIVHYNMPKDLESYYQEAGRAGRDGERAECVLLFSGQDEQLQRFLIEREEEGEMIDPVLRAEVQRKAISRLRQMVHYCRTQQCLRQAILAYFGEALPAPCGDCGSCRSEALSEDVTETAHLILRCVQETGERYGLGTVLELLRGAETKRLRQFRLDTHALHGALAHIGVERLRAIGEQLTAEGYLSPGSGRLPIAKLGPRAQSVLEDGEVVLLKLPAIAPESVAARGDAAALPVDASLFEALRTLRLRLATAQGVAAFMIFSDATLKDMCAKRPRTPAEMLAVKGVGDTKLRAYGDAFLEALRAHEA